MVIALRSKLGHLALRQQRLVATRLNQALRVRDVDSAKVDGKGILQSFVRLRVFAALLHLADGFDNSPGQVHKVNPHGGKKGIPGANAPILQEWAVGRLVLDGGKVHGQAKLFVGGGFRKGGCAADEHQRGEQQGKKSFHGDCLLYALFHLL